MLTEDYIMRMISQALAVLMTALGLKKAGKFSEAQQAFGQAVESLLGLNARLVDQLDDGMLFEKLTFMGKLDIERMLVLADIYREEAELYNSLGQADNCHFAVQRSLRLYLEVALASEASLNHELIQKIEGLRHQLAIPSMPIETRLALQDYLERLLAASDEFLEANELSRTDIQADFTALETPDLL
jgi:hypothetical protein